MHYSFLSFFGRMGEGILFSRVYVWFQHDLKVIFFVHYFYGGRGVGGLGDKISLDNCILAIYLSLRKYQLCYFHTRVMGADYLESVSQNTKMLSPNLLPFLTLCMLETLNGYFGK